jgi:histone deacetylase 1/2
MENANSFDYLEKIKIQVIENLKRTAHAPSVQSTEIPRTTIMGGTEEDDAELDDLDEDENQDSRSSKRKFDKRITRDDELDSSDDEEEARANGVMPQNGVPRRRNIMDYQNPDPAASDVEMDSGVASPVPNDVDDMTTALATEANAEVNAEVMEQKSRSLTAVDTGEAGPSNAPSRSHSVKQAPQVDNEGDIDMTEAVPEPAAQASTPPKAPISPTATVGPTSPAPAITEPLAETTSVKEEGEAERQDADITGESSKEVAEQSQL